MLLKWWEKVESRLAFHVRVRLGARGRLGCRDGVYRYIRGFVGDEFVEQVIGHEHGTCPTPGNFAPLSFFRKMLLDDCFLE